MSSKRQQLITFFKKEKDGQETYEWEAFSKTRSIDLLVISAMLDNKLVREFGFPSNKDLQDAKRHVYESLFVDDE